LNPRRFRSWLRDFHGCFEAELQKKGRYFGLDPAAEDSELREKDEALEKLERGIENLNKKGAQLERQAGVKS